MTMHRSFLKLAALTLAISAALPAQADSTVTTVTKTKHNYVYYRDHDIYFAPESKTYYWQADGKWQSGSALPENHRTYVTSGGVTVELDTDRPYDRHDWVVSKYKNARPGDATTTERTVATSADGSSTTTTTTTTQRKYVYYGEHDIYFAPESKTYYWQADGKWVSGAELPMERRSYITSGGVTIELDTDRPYTRHEYVVAKYRTNGRKDD